MQRCQSFRDQTLRMPASYTVLPYRATPTWDVGIHLEHSSWASTSQRDVNLEISQMDIHIPDGRPQRRKPSTSQIDNPDGSDITGGYPR